MSDYNTIKLKGDPNGDDRIENVICSAAIRPGSHVSFTGKAAGGDYATIAVSANREGPTENNPFFVLESPQLPRNRGGDHNSTLASIEGTYAANDKVPIWFAQPGDVVNVLVHGKGDTGDNLVGAGTYSVGDPLIPGGSGALFRPKAADSTRPVAIAYENKELTTQGSIGHLKALVI